MVQAIGSFNVFELLNGGPQSIQEPNQPIKFRYCQFYLF